MKLSAFSVMAPDMTPEEFIKLCKESNIGAIDWRYKDIPAEMQDEEISYRWNNKCHLPQHKDEVCWQYYKDLMDTNGIKASGIMNYAMMPDMKNAEEAMACAKFMGAKIVRLATPLYEGQSYKELFALIKKCLKEAEGLCREYGVKGVVELHGARLPASCSCAVSLVDGLNPDHIGVLLDPGNMIREGFEDYRMCVEMLGPYLAHVHVKNTVWKRSGVTSKGAYLWSSEWALMEQGYVPWERVIAELKAVGYDGYIALEDFGSGRSTADKLNFFVNYIGSML